MVEPSSVPLLLTGAAAASVLGFSWLALAMDVHWEQVHGGTGPSAAHQKTLRLLGGLLLAVALGLCLMADHATMAVLVWFMLLAGSAALNAFVLSWHPRWMRVLWPSR